MALKSPLLGSSSNKGQITKKSLFNLHKEQLSKGNDNTDNIFVIVNILGGVDNILADYLCSENNLNVSANALTIIQELLINPQKPNPKHLKILTDINARNNNNKSKCHHDHFGYEFDEYDTLLNKLYGKENSDKILRIIHGKMMRSIVIVGAIIHAIWDLIFKTNAWIYTTYRIVMFCFFWMPYWTSWILSLNRSGFVLMFQRFELWVKFVNSFAFGTVWCIYRYKDDNALFGGATAAIYLPANILVNIFVMPMATICISSLDAIKIKKIHKIAILMISALAMSFWLLAFQLYFVPHQNDYVIFIWKEKNINVSCQIMLWSTGKVMSIFFWKQAILSLIRDEKAVSIKYTPFIKWSNCNEVQTNEFKMREIRTLIQETQFDNSNNE